MRQWFVKVINDPFVQVFTLIIVLLGIWLMENMRVYTTPAPADKLADFFEDVAFGLDYDEGYSYVRKWQGDLHVNILDESDARDQEDLDMLLKQFSQLTGLNFGYDDVEKANLLVVFVKHKELPDYAKALKMRWVWPHQDPNDVRCAAKFLHGEEDDERGIAQRGIIHKSMAVLSTDLPQTNYISAFVEMMASGTPYKSNFSCIREELMQSLGLPKDSNIVSPSVLNDYDNTNHKEIYSANDTIVIRTLYDPRIKAGMPKDEAMKLVREIIIPELINAYQHGGEEALYQ